jgi:hypothetical protein
MLVRMSKAGTIIHCLWECKLVQPLWKAEWRFLKKLEIELHIIYWYCSWASNQRNVNQHTIETPEHICSCSTIHNSLAMETIHVPYNRWMNQETVVYIQNWILLSHISSKITCGLKVNGCNWRTSCLVKLARIRNTKGDVFSHTCKIHPKDKHVHKNKYDHIQTHM